MSQSIVRAAIVGASSLLGKELAELLNGAVSTQWDLELFDKEDAAGQVAAAGDEALVIQPVTAESFIGVDVAFFAGDAAHALEFWKAAVDAGASVVDLTGALEGHENVAVRSPFVLGASASTPNLSSIATVSPNSAAIMLGAVIGRLHAALAPIQVSATLLVPASQQGNAGLDEMHQQTVKLLSFQPLPQEVFDAQVAFNLSAELGGGARASLADTERVLRRQLGLIAGDAVAKATSVQVIQAPVFNGYTASMFVAVASAIRADEIERILNGDIVGVPGADDPPPSNQTAAQQGQILVRVRVPIDGSNEPRGFWLWMAADNLRLAARNAVACATELIALRPSSRVQ